MSRTKKAVTESIIIIIAVTVLTLLVIARAEIPSNGKKQDNTLVDCVSVSSPMFKYIGEEEVESIYVELVNKIYEMDTRFVITGDYGAAKDAALAALRSPEIFWIESIKTLSTENDQVVFYVNYNLEKWQRRKVSARMETLVGGIRFGTDSVASLVGRVQEWSEENVEYDNNAETQLLDCRAHADSFYIDQIAVCSGYSEAFAYAALESGYRTAYVVGYVNNMCHAWCIVVDENGDEVLVDLLNGGIVPANESSEYEAKNVRWYEKI